MGKDIYRVTSDRRVVNVVLKGTPVEGSRRRSVGCGCEWRGPQDTGRTGTLHDRAHGTEAARPPQPWTCLRTPPRKGFETRGVRPRTESLLYPNDSHHRRGNPKPPRLEKDNFPDQPTPQFLTHPTGPRGPWGSEDRDSPRKGNPERGPRACESQTPGRRGSPD